jgi:uncharacterized protein with ParB-like and HNH nuclease domain
MKGYAKPLHEFIEGHKIQFVIPVYQRNYDWLIDNCDQLFSDLVKLSRSNRCSHFFIKSIGYYIYNVIGILPTLSCCNNSKVMFVDFFCKC